MGYSYQDIDVRLKVLADMVEFVMKSFQVANPLDPFGQPKSLLDIYREVQSGVALSHSVNGVPEGEVLTEAPVEAPAEVTPAATGTQTVF